MAMIRNGKVYRNLPEQVQENKENIEYLLSTHKAFVEVDELPEEGEPDTIYLVQDGDVLLQYVWDADNEVYISIGAKLNVENGTGTNAVQEKMADATVNFAGRNPNAIALDGTLDDAPIPTGASGSQSVAFGKNTMALATASFTNGNKTVAKGEESHAEGYQSVTLGGSAHAEGQQTVAYGDLSHAEGLNTVAEAKASHTEGENTRTKANYIIVENGGTPAPDPSPVPPQTDVEKDVGNGWYAHAEGMESLAFAIGSKASGYNAKAYSRFGTANGINVVTGQLVKRKTEDNKDYYTVNHNIEAASAFGYYTKAQYPHQFVVGSFNDNKNNTIFEVGNGLDENSRSNAFEVYADGHAEVNGKAVATTSHTLSGDVVDTGSNQTITGRKTFNNNVRTNGISTVDGVLKIDTSGGVVAINNILRPKTNGDRDLGTSTYKWKDGYFSGTINCGIIKASYIGQRIIAQSNIVANNGSQDLGEALQGTTVRSFRDLHLNRNIVDDNGNSVTVADLAWKELDLTGASLTETAITSGLYRYVITLDADVSIPAGIKELSIDLDSGTATFCGARLSYSNKTVSFIEYGNIPGAAIGRFKIYYR